MRLDRWYWLPVFLIISLGVHVGVALMSRGAGGIGRGGKATEIEVDLVPRREIAASGLMSGRSGKRPSSARMKIATEPQPFSAPVWQQRPTRAAAIRLTTPMAQVPRPATNATPYRSAPGTAFPGPAQTRAELPAGAPGYGQNGVIGFGAPPQRVLRVSLGEDPAHPVTISPAESPAARPRPPAVRARPRNEVNSPPIYPEEARAQRQQGTVYLKVTVTADGKAESVELLFSSGFPLLDEAAITAVRDWSFDPAHTESGPFRSVISVPVPFPSH